MNVVDTCVTLKCNYLIPSIKLLPLGSPSVSCRFLKLCTLKQGYMLLILMCLSFCVDVPIDGDNPDHISWIYERALERADEFGIQGVTYRLTQGRNCSSDVYCMLLIHLVWFMFISFLDLGENVIVSALFPGSPALGYKRCNHEPKGGRVLYLFSSEQDVNGQSQNKKSTVSYLARHSAFGMRIGKLPLLARYVYK